MRIGSRSAGPMSSGNQKSASPIGPTKPGGSTPTTSRAAALRLIERPITPGSPANRRCQAAWPSITTFGASVAASAAVSGRPSAGATPRVSKKPGPASAPRVARGPDSAA